jgi:hypothetical protein
MRVLAGMRKYCYDSTLAYLVRRETGSGGCRVRAEQQQQQQEETGKVEG